jgi:hypothetical protein
MIMEEIDEPSMHGLGRLGNLTNNLVEVYSLWMEVNIS